MPSEVRGRITQPHEIAGKSVQNLLIGNQQAGTSTALRRPCLAAPAALVAAASAAGLATPRGGRPREEDLPLRVTPFKVSGAAQ